MVVLKSLVMAKQTVNPTFFRKIPGPFGPGRPGSILPEAYKKFWREWKVQRPQPVHYIEEPGRWKRNPQTGEVSPVQNVSIPLKFPKESHQQLWGGEGVIRGFQKRKSFRRRIPHFWVPHLQDSVVYSEILNKYMSVVTTERTINLIHKHFGFDHYILKTPACDLQSDLGVKLKRKLLIALLNRDLNHEDPEKNESVYNTYKHYLSNFTEEEIEWYGLSVDEAVAKMKNEEEESISIQPLKHQYRLDLLKELLERGTGTESAPEEKTSWLSKINPFSKKS